DGAERRVLVFTVVLAVAVEPAVRRRLHPRSPGLQIVLGVKMAPGHVGGADRVDGGEALRVPQGLDRRQAWVEAEVAVQVQDILLGHGDAGSFSVIEGVTMRDAHVEPVHGAALEEADENRAGEDGRGRWRAVESERSPSRGALAHPD